jgi:hypothetical protein
VTLNVDDWTALEIGIFEEAFERFGKHFHLIGQHVRLFLSLSLSLSIYIYIY